MRSGKEISCRQGHAHGQPDVALDEETVRWTRAKLEAWTLPEIEGQAVCARQQGKGQVVQGLVGWRA